jgi:eukaryotic-like serine/threonine-protein kinase
MHLDCPHCRRRIDYSSERPRFCAYCGSALETPVLPSAATTVDRMPGPGPATVDFDPDAPTLAPDDRAAEPDRPVEDPAVIGGYRLLQPKGGGGMGKVYEAEEIRTGRHVALKLIAREYSGSPDAVERFRREGCLASLITHPRCVFVLAADQEAGRPFIVMELMPGTTLKDLVDERGPLTIHDALLKILDVIDGLREAHRLGVIHRDVKPSNCFLEANGRVKIGDFGLSRSLLADSTLTQTGAFLGTPLFSSPEQIRKDPLDQQTDVYSVAATLYFLLTGQAPFQGSGDPAAILARVVCDPPPPARTLRPEIPAGLDRVLVRGLERQRERRWRSLDQLREALLPFVPGHLSMGGMGARLGAYLIDYFLLSLLTFPLSLVLFFLTGIDPATDTMGTVRPPVALMSLVLWVCYFAVPEALWGLSPGKWLLRLRVSTMGGDRPSIPRATLRALAFFVLLHSGILVNSLLSVVLYPRPYSHADVVRHYGVGFQVINGLPFIGFVVGTGLMLLPMRNRNGYRGLHELLSGTRVVRLPWPQSGRNYSSRLLEAGLARPVDVPVKVGPFPILGAVCRDPENRVLVGDDAALGRKVWLWLRPPDRPELTATRRDCGRAGRVRWLAGGQESTFRWDAFMASAGRPLPELITQEGPLPWKDARPVLEQLKDELVAAQKDGTVAPSLTLSQIWIQPNGGVQLLDFPVPDNGQLSGSPGELLPSDKLGNPVEQPRPCRNAAAQATAGVRGLMQQAACLMLQGRMTLPPEHIEAPLPRHATRMLDSLLKPQQADDLDGFAAELVATRDQPPEVTAARRAAHLAMLFVFLHVGLVVLCAADWMGDFTRYMMVSLAIPSEEETLQELEEGATRDFLSPAAISDPWTRLRAAVQFAEDQRLEAQVKEDLILLREERQARLRAFTWYARDVADFFDRSAEAQREAVVQVHEEKGDSTGPQADVRSRAQEFADQKLRLARGSFFFSGIEPLILLFWPAAWVVWAFVARGGFSFWIIGLSLVRSNGKPAGRFQCAWRALLVWLPATALLLLSAWCNAVYWSRWPQATASGILLWASCLTYWAAIVTLLLCAVLALWMPNRSLHDRLAGTYLVPR